MIVVSNASPLIIRAKIGHLELLRILYGHIIVPSEVHAEVVTPGVDRPGSGQVAQVSWLDVRPLSNPEKVSAAEAQSPLARGELAAILLAEELGADLVLFDERPARRLAQAKGLRVRGCVGILEAAFRNRQLADLRQAYTQLLSQRTYIERSILNASLAALDLPPL